jgi:hypothetical protein
VKESNIQVSKFNGMSSGTGLVPVSIMNTFSGTEHNIDLAGS